MNMRRLISIVPLVLMFLAQAAFAQKFPSGSFHCAFSDGAASALEKAGEGTNNIQIEIGDGIFFLRGDNLSANGLIALSGAINPAVTGDAGAFFANASSFAMTANTGENAGQIAFSKDGSGQPILLVALTEGQYFLGCYKADAGSINLAGSDEAAAEQQQAVVAPPVVEEKAPEPPPQKELTDAEKLELKLNTPPLQEGNEIQLMGPVSLTRPDEGHYNCQTTDILSDGEKRTSNQFGSNDDHTGFDLFADGSLRLKKKDGTFEEDGDNYRHNDKTGAIAFNEGTLSIYMKHAVHIRKDLSAKFKNISHIYETDYDSDGSLDTLIVCIFYGPPQSKSPNVEIAERAKKNLSPPPHAGDAIDGLFYYQQWQTMFGPNFTTYQVDYYYYKYFQPNGYVWLNDPPDDGDFEKLGCNKPMVDEKGEPTCTTYTVADGLFSKPTIRIGHDAAVPFEQDDGTISIDGQSYIFIKKQDDLRLDKTLSYFSYTGVLMREGAMSFKKDGQFESTSASGVLFTQEIPDVSRTTVTSYNPGDDLKGTYEIKDYSITLKTKAGNIYKKFFAQFSEGFIMVGGQPYIDRSD